LRGHFRRFFGGTAEGDENFSQFGNFHSKKFNHGWTRINTDLKRVCFSSVFIRVHPWLKTISPNRAGRS
jgi:hypothetical protein